jgi:hypothetical protein
MPKCVHAARQPCGKCRYVGSAPGVPVLLCKRGQLVSISSLGPNLASDLLFITTRRNLTDPERSHMPLAIPFFLSALTRSVLLWTFVIPAISASSPVNAADGSIAVSADPAEIAFARYNAGLSQIRPWRLETLEIDASLPGREERGRMRAIRRLLPLGKLEYRVLETAGDPMVRRQVILRYLSADSQAVAVPADSVAITPANYKFRYHDAVEIAGATAYSFLITPRQKREGLIKGELWIDGKTGAVVRQTGYFVKSPSIFVKRISVTRETVLLDGLAVERITHLSIDTRLIGRAELTIQERPFTDSAPDTEE